MRQLIARYGFHFSSLISVVVLMVWGYSATYAVFWSILLAILVIFTQVTSLGGFSAGEVVLIYGLAATAFGLADLAVGQVEALPDYIRTGEFDELRAHVLGQYYSTRAQ